MNLQHCRVVLRPRSPFEVFDLTLMLIRARARHFLRLSWLLLLPAWVATSVLAWWLDGALWLALIPLVLGPAIQAPFTVMGGRLLFADEVSLREVYSDTLQRAPALMGAWLIAAVGWTGTVCTMGYTGLFVQAALLYLTEAALLERVTPLRALRRSLRLAGGSLFAALVGSASRWILLLWFLLLFEMTGQTLTSVILQIGLPFGSLLAFELTPFALLGLFLAQPLIALYRLLLYIDVRTRSEGWDLQVTLRALGMSA